MASIVFIKLGYVLIVSMDHHEYTVGYNTREVEPSPAVESRLADEHVGYITLETR
ncbi:hypothetical protein PT974_06815 [Cladobotryum mycophilum]|uniref:Uncharacterized protein n=1 Tax=Cladobotryum mycophilum TaxID=491253 RepID=A0ABR0SMJ7_9HYPO